LPSRLAIFKGSLNWVPRPSFNSNLGYKVLFAENDGPRSGGTDWTIWRQVMQRQFG
jgi:hypothetical protein